MKFGRVEHPERVDFSLPDDHPDTTLVLRENSPSQKPDVYVGCAKWNRKDLKNFYPRGTRDELPYYARQFNAIELNATFYRVFPEQQYEQWVASVPEDFRFFPKVLQNVSHLRRLNEHCYPALERFLHTADLFGGRLGGCFIQMHPNFGPKNWDRVERFIGHWPQAYPLSVEMRHPEWFTNPDVTERLFNALRERGLDPVITDTAGRRDVLHMRLTRPSAFVRFVGSNHISDYKRLDDWALRLGRWIQEGLDSIQFFIHQNMERESPLLAAYFIERLNQYLEHALPIPKTLDQGRAPGTCYP
jgi:uncharacterized protein YecE (DUF72 family)